MERKRQFSRTILNKVVRMIGKIGLVGLLSVGMGTGMVAQTPVAPKTAAPAKPMAFDVISIKQNLSPQRNGPPVFGPTADGYRMVGGPLLLPIITAYLPQTNGATAFMPNQIKGLPDWVSRDAYDIDAKVADEDRADWQKPALQKTMLPVMLQALLEDRFKMVVHRETKDSSVYLLTVGKFGPKFKETDPTAEHPDGVKLPWGGVMVPGQGGATLYGTSMASLATLLSSMGGPAGVGRQIQDKTGLTGSYDIAIKPPTDLPPPPPPGGQPGAASDPGGGMSSMVDSVIESLGLKLESGKATVETLVVDHIEKPTAN